MSRGLRITVEKALLTVANCLFAAMALIIAPCSTSHAQTPRASKPPVATIRWGGSGESGPSAPALRTLEGNVKDAKGKEVPGAMVYLKSMKTSETLSVATDEKGAFRFVALDKNVDYKFWAQADRLKSDQKTISSFDDAMQITRSLTIK